MFADSDDLGLGDLGFAAAAEPASAQAGSAPGSRFSRWFQLEASPAGPPLREELPAAIPAHVPPPPPAVPEPSPAKSGGIGQLSGGLADHMSPQLQQPSTFAGLAMAALQQGFRLPGNSQAQEAVASQAFASTFPGQAPPPPSSRIEGPPPMPERPPSRPHPEGAPSPAPPAPPAPVSYQHTQAQRQPGGALAGWFASAGLQGPEPGAGPKLLSMLKGMPGDGSEAPAPQHAPALTSSSALASLLNGFPNVDLRQQGQGTMGQQQPGMGLGGLPRISAPGGPPSPGLPPQTSGGQLSLDPLLAAFSAQMGQRGGMAGGLGQGQGLGQPGQGLGQAGQGLGQAGQGLGQLGQGLLPQGSNQLPQGLAHLRGENTASPFAQARMQALQHQLQQQQQQQQQQQLQLHAQQQQQLAAQQQQQVHAQLQAAQLHAQQHQQRLLQQLRLEGRASANPAILAQLNLLNQGVPAQGIAMLLLPWTTALNRCVMAEMQPTQQKVNVHGKQDLSNTDWRLDWLLMEFKPLRCFLIVSAHPLGPAPWAPKYFCTFALVPHTMCYSDLTDL